MTRWLLSATLVCAALVFFERPVHAYVDPGSGSMVLQLLLGGVAGVGVIIKLYWRRIVDRVRNKDASRPEERPQGQ